MDRSEFSQDDPHGLTDLDLGGQPPRVLENPAFGEQLQAEGSADPLAFRADTVPFVPYDFFGTEETSEIERNAQAETSQVESEDLGPEGDARDRENRPRDDFRERSP